MNDSFAIFSRTAEVIAVNINSWTDAAKANYLDIGIQFSYYVIYLANSQTKILRTEPVEE